MSGRILLDTNIVILLFSEDETVKKLIAEADEVFISNIVIGELYFGAFNSSRKDDNIARIDDLVIKVTVLNSDTFTAKEFGYIKSELRKKGKPIPENDIWIAAIARQYDLRLMTKDEHFINIDGLDMDLI